MEPQERKLALEKVKGESSKSVERPTSPVCSCCGSSEIVKDEQSGEMICSSCGFVVRDKSFVANPQYTDSDGNGGGEPIGIGPPEDLSIHDKGLPTEISPKDRDGRGNPLSPKERALARKLRKWQKRCRVSGDGERNLAVALREIDRVASQLGVPRSVRRVASRIYREAADEGLVIGRSVEEVSLAVLYVACRDCQLPVTLEDIAGLSNVNERKIRQAYLALAQDLDLNLSPLKPAKYVQKFSDRLGLSPETSSKAIGILRRAYEEALARERAPSTTAAAALYIAAGLNDEEISQKKAERVGISQGAVSEIYRQVAEGLNINVKSRSWMLESFAK